MELVNFISIIVIIIIIRRRSLKIPRRFTRLEIKVQNNTIKTKALRDTIHK